MKEFLRKNKRNIGLFVLGLIISMIVGLLTSINFNLRFGYIQNDYGVYDSSYFLFSGYMIQKGAVPYVDIWDQKGVLLFLLNALMYGEGSLLGIFLRFCSLNTINIMLFKSIYEKMIDRDIKIWEFVAYSIFSSSFALFGINVELYSLVFMEMITLVLFRYVADSKNVQNGLKCAFLAGVLVAVLFNIRVKEAVFAITALIVMLMHEKDNGFKNVLEYLISALAGFALITLPIVAYYSLIGEFGEWLYANITFNFDYIANSAGESNSACALFYLSMIALACSFMFVKKTKNADIRIFLIPSIAIAMIGKGYFHYWTVTLPFIAIVYLLMIDRIWHEKDNNDRPVRMRRMLVMILVALSLFIVAEDTFINAQAVNYYAKNESIDLTGKTYDYQIASDELAMAVKKETGRTLDEVYMVDCPGHVYIAEDIVPTQVAYSYNSWWMAYKNPRIDKMLIDDIIRSGNNSDYLVFFKYSWPEAFIEGLEEEGYSYSLIYEEKRFSIYEKQ